MIPALYRRTPLRSEPGDTLDTWPTLVVGLLAGIAVLVLAVNIGLEVF